jgi:hypothetical protein
MSMKSKNDTNNLGNLTYTDIDNLEKNLSNPEVQNLTYYNEYIIRLLTQTLRNNRYLADTIANADMRSKMAYHESIEAKNLVTKNQGDMKFLLNIGQEKLIQSKDKGVPNAR